MRISIFPKNGKILDYLIPIIYVALILIAAVLIWRFLSPFLAVVVAAILSAILWIRKNLESQK